MTDLKSSIKFELLADSANLAEDLDKEDLKTIGWWVVRDYDIDVESRAQWETRNAEANKLALQIKEDKNFPWPNASNVKFPLVTIAALQFSARAYPALVSGTNIVKMRTVGADQDGSKAARAARVSRHMSYQIIEEDESWEEEFDRLLMCLPIQGCSFKKSYYDSELGHNVSEHVLAQDLVVPYFAKSLEAATRKTHVLRMPKRQVQEKQLSGTFLDVEFGLPQADNLTTEADKRQGITQPTHDPDRPRVILEQHRFLDLDGDGYEEPYIVTVDRDSKKVLRIVARFAQVKTDVDADIQRLADMAGQVMQSEEIQDVQKQAILEGIEAEMVGLKKKAKITRIKPKEFFTKYPFIPSPDGGFYDLGFGALLGPINESVNTLINQLLDAGTLSNSNTGFIGRGARIKGGKMLMAPFTWQKVDVAGGDLRNNVVPFPANPPSPVLFNLLSLLINYGERLSSVTDTLVGENPGQNTPAFTSQQMLEQGLKVFTGIFKRVYRSLRSEFRKLYELNRDNLSPKEYFAVMDGQQQQIFQTDYLGDPKDVRPAADPSAVSDSEKIAKAQFVVERSMTVPHYDTIAAERRLLAAAGVEDIQEILPMTQGEQGEQPAIPAPPNPEMQIKSAELELQANRDKIELAVKVAESQAKIMALEADSLLKRAKAAREISGIELDQFDAKLAEMKETREALVKVAELKIEEKNVEKTGGEGVA